MKISNIIVFLSFVMLIASCKGPMNMQKQTEANDKIAVPGPRVIIYKTKKNFSHNVPVILNKEKTKVISFPDVKDVIVNGRFTCPTPLQKGYWLDNRGINENVAFLSYTFQEYYELPKTPTAEELYNKIISKKPLKRMYRGGVYNRQIDITEKLNSKIMSNDFSDFIRLK